MNNNNQSQQSPQVPFGHNNGITVTLEDNTRTQYKPQVKILRRPRPNESQAYSTTSQVIQNNNKSLFVDSDNTITTQTTVTTANVLPSAAIVSNSNRSEQFPALGTSLSHTNQQGSNVKVKTYQEREAEYAKARLRILGSACNSSDELT